MSSRGNRSNPNATRISGQPGASPDRSGVPADPKGTHQESRDHNKHDNPGQAGHKPQRHSPAEEKR
jgi:hypothetical protein